MAGEKTVRGTPSQEVEGVWRGVTSAHMVGEKIVRGTPSQGVEGPRVEGLTLSGGSSGWALFLFLCPAN